MLVRSDPVSAHALCNGFMQGTVETLSEAPKPRAKPRPRQPKNTDAAAGAAAGGTAGGAAAAASKKRKQPAQQQQPPPEQHHREAATADAAAKKKRKRSEAPAGAQDKLPAGKKVCGSAACYRAGQSWATAENGPCGRPRVHAFIMHKGYPDSQGQLTLLRLRLLNGSVL